MDQPTQPPPGPHAAPSTASATTRAAVLVLAALLGLVVAFGLPTRLSDEEVTEADERRAVEQLRARQSAPVPGQLAEYRVSWQRGSLVVTDARGDWLWIALEETRATELVFGLDLPTGRVEALEGGGLKVHLDTTRAEALPRAPDKVRVATPQGVTERALEASPHEVAKGIFEGTERRPLRTLLEAVSR